MTDVPAQRTEPDTSDGICGADSPNGYVCSEPAGHDGPHVAARGPGRVIEEWAVAPPDHWRTDPAPADLPLTEAIAVERLALDEQQPESIRDAAARYDDALTAVAVAADAEQMAEEHYADRCAETTVARREAAEARLALLALLGGAA